MFHYVGYMQSNSVGYNNVCPHSLVIISKHFMSCYRMSRTAVGLQFVLWAKSKVMIIIANHLDFAFSASFSCPNCSMVIIYYDQAISHTTIAFES